MSIITFFTCIFSTADPANINRFRSYSGNFPFTFPCLEARVRSWKDWILMAPPPDSRFRWDPAWITKQERKWAKYIFSLTKLCFTFSQYACHYIAIRVHEYSVWAKTASNTAEINLIWSFTGKDYGWYFNTISSWITCIWTPVVKDSITKSWPALLSTEKNL